MGFLFITQFVILQANDVKLRMIDGFLQNIILQEQKGNPVKIRSCTRSCKSKSYRFFFDKHLPLSGTTGWEGFQKKTDKPEDLPQS